MFYHGGIIETSMVLSYIYTDYFMFVIYPGGGGHSITAVPHVRSHKE
jgi:hypothetical protein